MSDDDFPKPPEPHSTSLPAVDPWASADPLFTGTGGLAAGEPVAPGAEPITPGVEPSTPASTRRSRLARLSAVGLAGSLLIGLLVVGLPLLASTLNGEAGDKPDLTAVDRTATVPPSALPGTPGQPSVSAEPSPAPAKTKTSPTPKAAPTKSAKATRSPSPKAAAPSARVGELINGGSGTCLTGGGAAVPLILQSCNKSTYQRWAFRPDGTVRAGNLCMSLAGGATDNLTKIWLAPCDGSRIQQFYLNSLDDLISRHANKCLDAYDRQQADGTPVLLFPCFGQPNQSWYLK